MKLMNFSLAVVFACVGLGQAQAAVEVVSQIGDNGWVVWDTRGTSGSPATPTEVAAQIIFMGENETVADAAGGTPDASPSGSLNGKGYVRLDGTSANAGKSGISFVSNTALNPGNPFFVNYRYYNDLNPTSRSLGLNVAIADSAAAPTTGYNFSYVLPGNASGWNVANVTELSLFRLYEFTGPALDGAAEKTYADWAVWLAGQGVDISGFEVFRVGFNIGSSQRNSLQYLDWVQTSLLNNGDLIDFQSPVPEPMTIAVWSVLGLCGSAFAWRAKRRQLTA